MTKRLPCTPETQELMRELAKGLGMTYDEAIQFLYSKATAETKDTDPLLIGRKLREEAVQWQQQTGYGLE